ncbi:TPA: relaxase domain-containing protein [Vibrio parahaemolyticus]|uniref:MobF family relaxase n=1 Tax=Vibrio parahaemolyticus TaxID=670 RepID=UPI0011207745|nr:MobF family relaxase [Vibrio parahaemolyticus]MDF4940380.1 MobF family relaxase [Vibrio parahaemolyticus]TOK36568.1 exonuclease V subunit alpha [Vibrio parahaemolyticus]HCE3704266.1 relaxase domain-containing protein [Vibrio parahaemolyticus]HCG6653115.1 relaxase domain-containing protein [Vibrio parahaemolyticus]
MLTISPVNNLDYYSNLAEEDYYVDGGEPPGVWNGLGAQQLSLQDKLVSKSDYQNLMNGYSPTGKPLVQNAGSDKRRNAWDLCLSAPKSVSLLWARGNEEMRQKIQNAQKLAVRASIDFIERNAAVTRRDKAGGRIESTAGLVVASFDHCTSRDLDFQIHTHNLVCNVAPRNDGSWGSIDSRKIYRWQKAAGAIYRAELASQVRALGFQIEQDSDSFHVKGISKSLCDFFSKRSESISKELTNRGINSSASKSGSYLKLATRQHKQPVNHHKLISNWQAELNALGCNEQLLQTIRSNEPTQTSQFIETDLILEELTEKAATFRPQDLCYQVAINAIAAGLSAKEAEQYVRQIIRSSEVIELTEKSLGEPIYTTLTVLDNEQSMIKLAKKLATTTSKDIGKKEIYTAIKSAEDVLGFGFDEEQVEAVFSALSGPDLNITQGSAGAGKTTLMLAARHAYASCGYRVLGACIAKKAADNLFEETDIESSTISSLLVKIERGTNPLSNADVLIIDEAGQVPSHYLQQLLFCAEKAKCKLILSGEDKQLDAITRGGALRYLSRPEVIGTQRIENIRRQRLNWARQTVADFRDGKSAQALQSLKKHGCLHWDDSSEAVKNTLIAHWYQYQKNNPEKSTLVMAQRWRDVKELSMLIRNIHINEGRVGQENISLVCSVSDKQFEFEYSKGDRVKFCRNDYRHLKVSNGTLGTIQELQRLPGGDVRFTIATDDKRVVSFLASEYRDELGTNLCLAYALTVYSAQGTTIDGNTFTYYTAGMDRANTYVAASRHKDESHIFCNRREIDERLGANDTDRKIDDKERRHCLAAMMSRENTAKLAIELLPENHIMNAPEVVEDLELQI